MKNLKIKSIYELNNYDYRKLYLKRWDELALFEWDSDYMILENEYPIYFAIIWNTVYISDDDIDDENIEKLLNFCNSQNTKITKSGNSYRLENEKWKYFDENTRDEFENYNWLKIAYRWWAGYYYTLFKYID